MNQYPVAIPFDKKDELKNKYKLIWNSPNMIWMCGTERIYNLPGMLPYHLQYLDVHFVNKDAAKKLGCRWDSQSKRWYIACGLYTASQTEYESLAIKTKVVIEINYDDVTDEA